MNFGFPRRGEGVNVWKAYDSGLDWPEEKDNFSNTIILIFAEIKI